MAHSPDDSIEFSLSNEFSTLSVDTNELNINATDYVIEKVIQFTSRNNLSFKAMEDLLALMKNIPGLERQLYDLPTTKYAICRKVFSSAGLNTSLFIRCTRCSTYVKCNNISHSSVNCSECNILLKSEETNFFVHFEVKNQIVQSFKKNYRAIVDYDGKISENNENVLSDIWDGIILRKIRETIPNVYSLMINTDGASAHTSTNKSIWPILFIQNNLPPEIRFKSDNLLMTGLYFGEEKPIITDFFEPVAQELKVLSRNGLVIDVDGSIVKVFPAVTHASVDLQAKCIIQNMKQFNGYNACSYCMHPGNLIRAETNENVRYISTNTYEYRSHNQMLIDMDAAKRRKTQVNGVKRISAMVAFDHFDLIFSFCGEYMHMILLGVQTTLMNLWFDSQNHDKLYYINSKKQELLNKRLLSIKPCKFASKPARDITKRKKFQANEIRSLLIYFFPFCLERLLSTVFLDHFRLLSSATYILLREKISENELNVAEQKLNKFVRQFEQFYGENLVTMNIHLLTHVCQTVRYCGPLWCQSAFPFEKYNGVLLKYICGPTDVLKQILKRYILYKQFDDDINNANNIVTTCVKGKSESIRPTEDEKRAMENVLLHHESPTLDIYKRIVKNREIFTSVRYVRPKKKCDYFVAFNCGRLGFVRYYFCKSFEYYAMIEEFLKVD